MSVYAHSHKVATPSQLTCRDTASNGFPVDRHLATRLPPFWRLMVSTHRHRRWQVAREPGSSCPSSCIPTSRDHGAAIAWKARWRERGTGEGPWGSRRVQQRFHTCRQAGTGISHRKRGKGRRKRSEFGAYILVEGLRWRGLGVETVVPLYGRSKGRSKGEDSKEQRVAEWKKTEENFLTRAPRRLGRPRKIIHS